MQRTITFSSSSLASVLAVALDPLPFPFCVVPFSSLMSRSFVYWPLVARPERRGSSARKMWSVSLCLRQTHLGTLNDSSLVAYQPWRHDVQKVRNYLQRNNEVEST